MKKIVLSGLCAVVVSMLAAQAGANEVSQEVAARKANGGGAANAQAKGLGQRPDGTGHGSAKLPSGQAAVVTIPGSGIDYHGGPIVLGTSKIYYIWYGNWGTDSGKTILTDLAQNIGGSNYFNINTTYFNGNKQYVSNSVAYGGAVTDNYSQGNSITSQSVKAIVNNALYTAKTLPVDPQGVYFVLTSKDVSETSGLCSNYCGYHNSFYPSGIKFAFVGNPLQCTSNATACMAQPSVSPNGNPAADGMASVIAHELEETVTDPNLDAWYANAYNNGENGDLCAWNFGSPYTAGNGAYANMKLGTRDFYIQQNWVNTGLGYCGNTGYITATEQLYMAYVGRPTENAAVYGMSNTLRSMNAATTVAALDGSYTSNAALRSLIDGMANSPESKSIYPQTDTAQYITAIYQNLFSRAPESAGLAFWMNLINNGTVTRNRAPLAIMAAALQNATTDTQTVLKKTKVAADFTSLFTTPATAAKYSGNTPATTARHMLSNVSYTIDVNFFESTSMQLYYYSILNGQAM